jgi:hypothetical protein
VPSSQVYGNELLPRKSRARHPAVGSPVGEALRLDGLTTCGLGCDPLLKPPLPSSPSSLPCPHMARLRDTGWIMLFGPPGEFRLRT